MNPEDQFYVDKKLSEFEAALLKNQKPPWAVILSFIGVLMTILGGLYVITVTPINTRLDKMELHLEQYYREMQQDHRNLYHQDLPGRKN